MEYISIAKAAEKITDIRVAKALKLFSSVYVMPKHENVKPSKYQINGSFALV